MGIVVSIAEPPPLPKEIYRDSSRNVHSQGDGCEGREKVRGTQVLNIYWRSIEENGREHCKWQHRVVSDQFWREQYLKPFQTHWTYLVSKQVYSSLINVYVRILLGIWI